MKPTHRLAGWIAMVAMASGCGLPRPGESSVPSQAVATSSPTLSVQQHTQHSLNPNTERHCWTLQATMVEQLVGRLYFIADGSADVMYETVLKWDKQETHTAEPVTGDIVLLMQDAEAAEEHGKRQYSMSVEFKGAKAAQTVTASRSAVLQPTSILGISASEHGGTAENRPHILYCEAMKPGGEGTWSSSDVEKMVEESKEGTTFVAVSVEWKPQQEP